MLARVVLEAVLLLALDLAKRGDGTVVPVEEDEIERFAGRLRADGAQHVAPAAALYERLGDDLVDPVTERCIEVVHAAHGDDAALLAMIFAGMAEVVKVDDWISDDESRLVTRIRKAWGLPGTWHVAARSPDATSQ